MEQLFSSGHLSHALCLSFPVVGQLNVQASHTSAVTTSSTRLADYEKNLVVDCWYWYLAMITKCHFGAVFVRFHRQSRNISCKSCWMNG
jgi:hypothetical protein